MIVLNDRFPLYPDDRSNSFGSANELNKSGGLFDTEKSERKSRSGNGSKSQKGTDYPETSLLEVNNLNNSSTAFDEKDTVKDAKPETTKKQAPKKGKPMAAILTAAAVLLAGIAFGVLFLNTHVLLGELFGKHEFVSLGTKELDLSGSDYNDYSRLSRLKSMDTVNLTNSPFSNLSDLYGCSHLKRVILADRILSADNCIDFYRQLPDAQLVCSVDINGQVYHSEVKKIKLLAVDSESIKKYAALTRLEKIDMTEANVSQEAVKVAYETFPDCVILANLTVNNNEYRTDAELVKLSGILTNKDIAALEYFKNLKKIDVMECSNPELINPFLEAHSEIRLNAPLKILGKTVGTDDELIDLRGRKYSYTYFKNALDEALPKLTSVKKIDMCGCGLTNREMEQLCEAYPKIKFVWMVHFGVWNLRTDAVAFAALNSNGMERYSQDDYAPLFKYCTDLRALDLGHSLITDISAVSSLKKLRAIILTDNKIKDISAFSELKELEFIEMNATNKIPTLEPLRNLKNLKYINLWGSDGITDLSPLYHHDQLQIVIFDRAVPNEERERFIESNPNCNVSFKVDYSLGLTTTKDWRDNPYRQRLKKAFKTDKAFFNWRYITGFDEETGEYIVDYSSNQYWYK